MQDVCDEFSALLNKGIGVLVSSLMCKINRALQIMSKMPWSTLEEVGDQSEYVSQIDAILKEEMPMVAHVVSPNYHTYFCTQTASKFIPAFISYIFKCKRIGELGGQQLALDSSVLTGILLRLPELGKGDSVEKGTKDGGGDKKGSPVKASAANSKPTPLARYIRREMGKAEALCKTLVSPAERMIVTFTSLLREQAKTEELVKIMNLRGIKKSDQQMLFEDYNKTVSPSEQLAPVIESEGGLGKLFSKFEQIKLPQIKTSS